MFRFNVVYIVVFWTKTLYILLDLIYVSSKLLH